MKGKFSSVQLQCRRGNRRSLCEVGQNQQQLFFFFFLSLQDRQGDLQGRRAGRCPLKLFLLLIFFLGDVEDLVTPLLNGAAFHVLGKDR